MLIILFLVYFCSKHMNAFIEDILSRIQDLLELAPPVTAYKDHMKLHLNML